MGGEYERRLALSKRTNGSPKHALNVIVHMDMPRAIQFRYFWLEILCSGQAAEAISALVDLPKVADLRDQARLGYIAYVASEKERALKTSAPGMSEGERKSYARTEAEKEIRVALLRWFDFTASDLDQWFNNTSISANLEDLVEEDVDTEEVEEPENDADGD